MSNKDDKIAQLESIIDFLPGHTYWKDLNLNYLGCNSGFAKILNLSNSKDIIGKSDFDFLDHNQAAIIRANDQTVLDSGEEACFEEAAIDVKGKPAIYLSRKVPLRNASGEVIGLIGISLDITVQKANELALKQAKEEAEAKSAFIENMGYLKNLINAMPANVYWKNREGKYLGCNERQAKLLGLANASEIIGKTSYSLVPKPIADRIEEIDNAVMSNNKEQSIEEAAFNIHNEPAIYLSYKAPVHNEKNEVIGLLGISFDISEQKASEQALKRAKQQIEEANKIKSEFIENMSYLNNVIAAMPGHVYWKNREGVYLGCNERQAKTFGLSNVDEMRNKTIYDLIPENFARIVEEIDNAVMQSKVSKSIEESGYDTEGNQATYLSNKVPLFNEKGKVIGLLGISIDITEQKKTLKLLQQAKEYAEAANNAKTEFIMNMSHDIRTPFSGIIGFASLLKHKESNPEKKVMLEHIIQSSNKILELFNEILLISKLENEYSLNQLITFDLYQLIKDVRLIMLAEVRRKNIDFLIDYDAKIPRYIIGDKIKLHRILLNLVSNGIKFTNAGHIAISVKLAHNNNNKVTLNFFVKDTGMGIPPDKYQIIFERFNRLTSAYDGNYSGIGLGLYIVKKFINELGGDITLESQLNHGSTFIFALPFDLPSPDMANQTINKNETNTLMRLTSKLPANNIKRVLLVEDDAISQKVTAMLLQEYTPWQVDIAKSGQEAIAKAKAGYDLIFMDIGLPDISGFAAAQSIQAWYKANNKIVRIIGLTAHIDDKQQQLAASTCMDGIITKPLSVEFFLELLS